MRAHAQIVYPAGNGDTAGASEYGGMFYDGSDDEERQCRHREHRQCGASSRSCYPQFQIERITGGVMLTFPAIPGYLCIEIVRALRNLRATAQTDPPGSIEVGDATGPSGRFHRVCVTSSP